MSTNFVLEERRYLSDTNDSLEQNIGKEKESIREHYQECLDCEWIDEYLPGGLHLVMLGDGCSSLIGYNIICKLGNGIFAIV